MPTTRRTPKPGVAVRGSRTGRPLLAAMDLLGRRWSLRVLWELRDGAIGARTLLARCDGMSSSVLYQRLRELQDAGLVVRDAEERYALSRIGTELGDALQPLDRWAGRWATAGAQDR